MMGMRKMIALGRRIRRRLFSKTEQDPAPKPALSAANLDELRAALRAGNSEKYGGNPLISIGDFTYGLPEISLLPSDDTPRVTIGKFCSIAPGVVFLGNCEHHTDWHSTFPFNVFLTEHAGISGHPFGKGDIVVGNDVWIARDARILSGVTIGDGAVIAAGALVTKDVPPYTIAGGVPAKPIKARFSHAITEKLLEMAWWSWPDERIFEAVPLLQSNDFNALHDYYTKKIKDSLRQ